MAKELGFGFKKLEGEGEGDLVPIGAKVKVHFTGKFENGEVFDSSLKRKPVEFETGQG